MIKIWLLLMIMSSPGQPSVKYTASIYSTEYQCEQAQIGFQEAYEAKPQSYKDTMKVKAMCIPFDSFPIVGMQSPVGA
jgi:hypothetical protein